MKLKNFVPALKFGAKIMPEDLAGMIGLPFVGDVYYVDPTNGSDTANDGADQGQALKTLTAAYNKLTDNHHDVVIITPGGTGSGTATSEPAAITWAKNLCHVIGNVAGTPLSSRARIGTTVNALSPFINIQGQGNSFHNIQIFQGSGNTTGYVNVRVSGDRNTFENVHFVGSYDTTAVTNAGYAALQLYGAGENYFSNCTIGEDTVVQRASTNANLLINKNASNVACARNIFDNCIFPMYSATTTNLFIQTSATGDLDRFNLFRYCQFINASASGSGTAAAAVTIAGTGGMIILQNCLKVGATAWGNTSSLYLLGESSNSTYNQGIGYAVNPSA